MWYSLKTVARGCALAITVIPTLSHAAISLGAADQFALLAGASINNTGPSTIQGGDVGVSPGSSVTGFPPGLVVGIIHSGDSVAAIAQAAAASAYQAATALAFTQDLTGLDLGGMTLTPGVYHFNSAAALNGQLILDSQNNGNAQFIFQIGSTLTTGSLAGVSFINSSGNPGTGVFWQVGSSATIGTGTAFAGNLLANTSISLSTGSSINYGSAMALGGAVTLDTNTISHAVAPAISPVPEPSMVVLYMAGIGVLLLAAFSNIRKQRGAVSSTNRSPANLSMC